MPIRRRLPLSGLLWGLLLMISCATWPAHVQAASDGSTFVFFEKFSDSNPDQWNVQSLPDGSSTYLAGGSYHIVRPKKGTMRGWPLQIKAPTGFRFNVRLRLVEGTDPYEGITFWDDLANNFTLFAITPDGRAGLFRHGKRGYKVLVTWRSVPFIHKGINAINSLSVNLDSMSIASGNMLLINGKQLGAPCHDLWHTAVGQMPKPPAHGLFVGVLAGTYRGATHVEVQRASMYNGTAAAPVPVCH